MPRFTAANAREMAARSHVARKVPHPSGETAGQFVPQRPQTSDDPLARELTRAIEETLAKLRACEVAKDRASLAQALRNLRETYHLVTGQAKPGVLKGASKRQPRNQSGPGYHFPSEPEPVTPETGVVQPSIPEASQTGERPEANHGQSAGGEVRKVVWTHGKRTPVAR